MDHHPVILQEWIKVIAILQQAHIVLLERACSEFMKDGRIVKHPGISEEHKRIGTHFHSEDRYAKDHGGQQHLCKTHNSHYRTFPVFLSPYEEHPQNTMPHTP